MWMKESQYENHFNQALEAPLGTRLEEASAFGRTKQTHAELRLSQKTDLDELMRSGLVEKAKKRAQGHRFSALEHEIPKGSLIEWSGPLGGGKTGALLKFLSENPSLRVAWVEEEMTIYPGGFQQKGVGLDRVVFLEAGRDFFWSALQALRSQLFPIVVLFPKTLYELKEMDFRRLQLTARQTQATLFIVNNDETIGTSRSFDSRSWFFSMRVRVTKPKLCESFHVQVLKNRFESSSQLSSQITTQTRSQCYGY